MFRTPEERRRRLAAIRERIDQTAPIIEVIAPTVEVDMPNGETRIEAVEPDGTHREPTAAERKAHEAAAPFTEWAFTIEKVDGLKIARPRVASRTRAIRIRERRSPTRTRTTRTTSRRARTSAPSTADPSSSRPRPSAKALRAVRTETTRLILRVALLVIGGAR